MTRRPQLDLTMMLTMLATGALGVIVGTVIAASIVGAQGGVRGGSPPCTDVPDGQYYSEPVQWAWTNTITNGTSATTFSPGAPITRAEMITFLFRFHETFGGPEGIAGPAGPMGPTGPQGPRGAQGLPGANGTNGVGLDDLADELDELQLELYGTTSAGPFTTSRLDEHDDDLGDAASEIYGGLYFSWPSFSPFRSRIDDNAGCVSTLDSWATFGGTYFGSFDCP